MAVGFVLVGADVEVGRLRRRPEHRWYAPDRAVVNTRWSPSSVRTATGLDTEEALGALDQLAIDRESNVTGFDLLDDIVP